MQFEYKYINILIAILIDAKVFQFDLLLSTGIVLNLEKYYRKPIIHYSILKKQIDGTCSVLYLLLLIVSLSNSSHLLLRTVVVLKFLVCTAIALGTLAT